MLTDEQIFHDAMLYFQGFPEVKYDPFSIDPETAREWDSCKDIYDNDQVDLQFGLFEDVISQNVFIHDILTVELHEPDVFHDDTYYSECVSFHSLQDKEDFILEEEDTNFVVPFFREETDTIFVSKGPYTVGVILEVRPSQHLGIES